jgi:hypothetical protein
MPTAYIISEPPPNCAAPIIHQIAAKELMTMMAPRVCTIPLPDKAGSTRG